MADAKLFAGHAVRRLRRQLGLSQTAMADALEVSASYLNLVERNQRPVSATLMLRLAQTYDFDPRKLAASEPGGGAEALRRRLADPLFADLEIDRHQMEEWLAGAPGGAEAFARAYDRLGGGAVGAAEPDDAGRQVRREIERWRNHFPDLDAAAEALADELRITAGDLYGAMAERLRVKHQLAVRILPADVMPDRMKRLDLHARQIQLSEMLDASARGFALAERLAEEARPEIDALAKGAGLDRAAERLYRRHLTGYFAAAVMMPYARFLRACEASGYDLELLQRRFGASFSQVAHRLTTLQRVGARGLPFFLLRVDRAGQVSKRYAGASASPLVEGPGLCPLWNIFDAFARDETIGQLVELEDGSRWFTVARAVQPQGARVASVPARFAIGIGLAAAEAHVLAVAAGRDLAGRAVPIGLGCRACTRPDCPQRSAPPAGRAMLPAGERESGVTPFGFALD
ncbi:short-chain fatty acyl-CoA regulator family protein [Sphingomonas psychrotolerans]|uniref:Short-chain fatty acyl-CoA regulator family protein n=1 Tax=Sphingomonas psychrotolerans TaxID=1327635 RepID=A0ABU3N610_9SPHN|nr:short-chain fatty acyl-CoA regulator family protein [Sphingomonas psychrotolerans]MDT8758926.1 short-chain fatty acyl-CoA regulator family protein [Sphingomonas psychrotolerans]